MKTMRGEDFMLQESIHKISIIVPIYNAEKYLKECLDSLINQSYKNIEILCINDGSKDNSLNILKEYAQMDRRVLVFSQKNSGPAMARNVGLANANGEYLMFCDADDYYAPTMCEEMINAISSSDYDFVMCDANIIETHKNTRSPGAVAYNNLNIFNEYILNSDNRNAVRSVLWNKIFKMEKIRRFDIVFPIGFEMDDDAFIYQYVSVSQKTYGLNKKLYNYRLINTSIVASYESTGRRKLFDIIFAYEFIIKQLIKNKVFEENRKWLGYTINNKVGWAMNLLSEKESIEFLHLTKTKLLKYFSIKDISPHSTLTFIKNKKYEAAYSLYKGVELKSFLKLFKIKRTAAYTSISILGIQILKKEKMPMISKYYMFGVKYWEKKQVKIINFLADIKGYMGFLANQRKEEARQIVNFLSDIKGCMGFLANQRKEEARQIVNFLSDIKGYIHHQIVFTQSRITSALISTAFLHQKTFNGYKNKHQNSEIILIGGGPTVNYFKPFGKHTYVGLNRAFLVNDIKFDYLFASDIIGIEQFIPELMKYSNNTTLFLGNINCGKGYQIPESVALKLKCKRYNTTNMLTQQKTIHNFALDIETEPLGAYHSVAFQAMQFILYTNPARIYLVGIDCSGAGKHFAGVEHNVADRGEDIEELQQVQIKEWMQLKEFVELYYPETEIVSINPIGLKSIFTDVWTREYLLEHPEINPTNVRMLEDL